MAEDKQKILKLKFEIKKKDEKTMEEIQKEDEKPISKNNNIDKKIEEPNEVEKKKVRGMPQIITNPSSYNVDKTKPFRKKTFIPKNNLNENKFAIKKPIIKPKLQNLKSNTNTGFKKPLFDKQKFSTVFPSFISSTFEKKNEKKSSFTILSDQTKKKKNTKKESTKPKLTTFSNLIGNNFIGKIEDSTLEYSEYYKIRKERKNVSLNKNKPFIAKTIELENEISLKELASLLSTKVEEIEKQARYIGYEILDNILVDIEVLEMIATSLGHKVIRKDSLNHEKFNVFNIKVEEKDSRKRPPIVAIVGHVDHGKTSLLDKIRKSNLTKTEVGGITQKIAAYSVQTKNGAITFIDTPGHAAFTNMRKRGININDITILVISAVEGIKEQTIEAIKEIKTSKTQLIITVTKSDLPNSNINKIKQELTKYNIFVKDYGGDIEIIEISSITGHNIDLLLQTILVYADIMDLKANFDSKAIGVVLESRIDPKVGVFATLLIQQGTLKIGDICSTLQTFGKVKGIWNDLGKKIKEASPSIAVEVLGLSECPTPGEKIAVLNHDLAAELTKKRHVKEIIIQNEVSLKNLLTENKPTLNLILNSDTQGGLEALETTLDKLTVIHSKYKIIKKSVGKVKESDFDLAKLTNSTIVNYNLSISKDIEHKAKNDKVPILTSKIIYELEQAVKNELEKLVTLIEEEIYLGTAIVQRLFKSSKIGNISGCIVTNGKILKGSVAKVFRKEELVFKGKIESLKKSKDDVKEVNNGLECGIFTNYKDIAEGDEIICYKIEYKKPS